MNHTALAVNLTALLAGPTQTQCSCGFVFVRARGGKYSIESDTGVSNASREN